MNPDVWGYLSLVSLKVRPSTPWANIRLLLLCFLTIAIPHGHSRLTSSPLQMEDPFGVFFRDIQWIWTSSNLYLIKWSNNMSFSLFLLDWQKIGSRAVIQVCCEGMLPHCSVHLLGKGDPFLNGSLLVSEGLIVYRGFPLPSWTCRTSRSSGRSRSYRTS